LSGGPGPVDEEALLQADPRLQQAVADFNAADWYACHDGFEALWHETQGPMRPVLQGLLQIAVAELHLERDNRRGATVLMGEGLGRLRRCDDEALGLALAPLRQLAAERLSALQQQGDLRSLPLPRLELARATGTSPVH
jgi:predicted metal-dependent hydrolase